MRARCRLTVEGLVPTRIRCPERPESFTPQNDRTCPQPTRQQRRDGSAAGEYRQNLVATGGFRGGSNVVLGAAIWTASAMGPL